MQKRSGTDLPVPHYLQCHESDYSFKRRETKENSRLGWPIAENVKE